MAKKASKKAANAIVGEDCKRSADLKSDWADCIYFYSHTRSEYASFSQFFACEFSDEHGVRYNCAEQFMMASKARVMGDSETLSEILASGYDPASIKRLGRMVSPFDQEAWERVRFDVVSRGNYLKFSQNPGLRKVLLSTGERTLAEAAGSDAIWGIGVNLKDATAGAPWRGLNLLGQALMRARTAIQAQAEVPPAPRVRVVDALAAAEAPEAAAATEAASAAMTKAADLCDVKKTKEQKAADKAARKAANEAKKAVEAAAAGEGGCQQGKDGEPARTASQAELRAEARAKQEAQRAAKGLPADGGGGYTVSRHASRWTHYLVLDFEATCERDDPTQARWSEIIEFPCVCLDAHTLQVIAEVPSRCRRTPEISPNVSRTCAVSFADKDTRCARGMWYGAVLEFRAANGSADADRLLHGAHVDHAGRRRRRRGAA